MRLDGFMKKKQESEMSKETQNGLREEVQLAQTLTMGE